MPDVGAILFDFDGVLLESELELNRITAELLTELGHEVSLQEALHSFTGLNGRDVVQAMERKIGALLPAEFFPRMRAHSSRALDEGIEAVAGAVRFVRALPPDLPRAVTSSSSTHWIATHLAHLGLREAFGERIFSGREHVERGKPAPDLYLYAADRLGVPIARCVVIEDSRVGATGALASGARVIGFAGGSHCLDDHGDMLRALGVSEVAHDFDEVRALLRLA